ncbi:MAG: HD domain-containing protein [Myxococcota bacterium]
MVPKTFIADLVLDTHVRTAFLVSAKVVRQTKSGKSYLCVTLTDRSGAIEGRAWEHAEMLASRFDDQDFVMLTATVTSYQGIPQLKVLDIERVDESDVHVADYLPVSRWEPEAMYAQLKELVLDEVRSPVMRQFFRVLFGDERLMEKFKRAPAAKVNHHAYLGGLLEHVLSMARVAVQLANHYARYYPGLVDKDLLIAGCILHDLGKCRELSYERGLAYTTHGQLIGHITHGVELVNDIAAHMNPAPPEAMLLHIKHLVLSHHGRLEYGSPVRPRTPEAMLLHQIDMIDSRMAMVAKALDNAAASEDAERWTEYNRALETRVFAGQDADADWRAQPSIGPGDLLGPGVTQQGHEADGALAARTGIPNHPAPRDVHTPSFSAARTSKHAPRSPDAPHDDMNLNLFGE